MASIIPGYEYDIFISYRQKDNKHDGWVTEFVNNLKGELESTFKEEVSVYFDINPHDGLLETHDVDASLKDKLKCLIFIPIISRTYCDPKSFAWEHEFKAFVEQASQDHFGLKVKLQNGNVANRVLPVRIHELDITDIKQCESVLGGVLRGVDFIYKESGFNRPLKPDDDEKINLNKTKYRNQIAKVALAIKENIDAVGQHEQRSEVVHKEIPKPVSIPRKSNKTKIIISSVIVVALVVLGYFLIPILVKPSGQLEKSIAVLPFKNESPVDSNRYFINGIMEEVLTNLQKIKDFRVLSRTSTDQYRGSDRPTIPEIGKKLGVNYIVEGSGQKYGNTFRLRIQLIKAKGKEAHLWAKSYEQEIRETKDIFSIQSQIAQSIAAELKATITPEEKGLIEKTPTTNLTAYDFYTRGREELGKYYSENNNKLSLRKAEDLIHKALDNDPAFAPAYVGLARVYWTKLGIEEYLSKNYIDSVLILCNKAISFDNKLSEAYSLKGDYYSEIGKKEQAIEEYDKAIKFNPNDWMAYIGKGSLYYADDLVNNINCLQKAVSINRGPELPSLLATIGWAYFCAGFPEKAKYYYQERMKLDGDSLSYYDRLAWFEFYQGNFNKSIEYAKKVLAIDSAGGGSALGSDYAWLGQKKESLKYHKKDFEILKAQGGLALASMHRFGYAYWQNGYKKEAEYYFNEQIKYCNSMIELKRPWGQKLYTYYDLAGVYAIKGEKNKAYENLRIFNQIQRVPFWMSMLMKTDPLLNNIRNEPEFQQIARDVEAKYQAEHERVRKWLEENNML
jgi:TolB-like protein